MNVPTSTSLLESRNLCSRSCEYEARSSTFLFKQIEMKSLNESENCPAVRVGAGSITTCKISRYFLFLMFLTFNIHTTHMHLAREFFIAKLPV